MTRIRDDEVEVGYLLRLLGKDRALVASRLKVARADSVFSKNRHPNAIQTDELIILVDETSMPAFLRKWAAALCRPLEQYPEHAECVAVNSSTEQGAPMYDDAGVVVGRLIRWFTTKRVAIRLEKECRDVAEFVANETALAGRLRARRWRQDNPLQGGAP